VTKPDTKRADIIQRLTAYVLAQGLSASSLRPLAKAAGTSDRMLLYYFKDKAEIITAVLEQISAQLVEMVSAHTAAELLPLDALHRKLAGIVFEDALWPYMRIWLDVAARAAMAARIGRGQAPTAFASLPRDCSPSASAPRQPPRPPSRGTRARRRSALCRSQPRAAGSALPTGLISQAKPKQDPQGSPINTGGTSIQSAK
jgi:AcrR family transcriptional regulator